ncbi:hypothetical protein [Bacillus sp. AFS031507]|uniref:hypothetical protein n=1 Tax=Bacillus sp. AFS031507 TaxID=2033496 RepID=UPI000BFE48EE|nr:hypothetical protein [Bacillus sp. AFS031507]PGY15229.1 hypothetical protein COE25_02945 [Bacillus sp. AFS031507]
MQTTISWQMGQSPVKWSYSPVGHAYPQVGASYPQVGHAYPQVGASYPQVNGDFSKSIRKNPPAIAAKRVNFIKNINRWILPFQT